MKIGQKVVVTTSHRGVFFGTLAAQEGDVTELTEARNCLVWSAATKGFLGLAERGPQGESRVGPAVARLQVLGVTSVAECSAAAALRWEAEPWA